MTTWPAIEEPSLPLDQETLETTLAAKAENGFEMTRPRTTRIQLKWSLKWPGMSADDFSTLKTFYETTTAGGSTIFEWTSPTDGETYDVRFDGPPKAVVVQWTRDTQLPKYWSVQVNLKEV